MDCEMVGASSTGVGEGGLLSTAESRGRAPERTRRRLPRANWARPRERAKYCSREGSADAYCGPWVSTRRRVVMREGQMMRGTAWAASQARLATL